MLGSLRKSFILFISFVLTGSIVACAEEGTEPVVPTDPASLIIAQTAALEQLARSLAVVLDDPASRMDIVQRMRRSPFSEHKLSLEGYVHALGGSLPKPDGGALNAGTVREIFAGLPPLEIYLPVSLHRTTWRGDSHVLVAVQSLAEDDEPAQVAFGEGGTRVRLSGDRPPSVPTIVIGPAEVDFSHVPDRSSWTNTQHSSGLTVGNWTSRLPSGSLATLDECDPQTALEPCPGEGGAGGGSSSWAPPSDAVYTRTMGTREFIDQMWTSNDHEPWDKGAPEFKLFFTGTSDSTPSDDLHESFGIPEEPWAGSDDPANSSPREFGPSYLKIVDHGYWGDRIHVKCIEEDTSWGDSDLTVSGTVKFTDSISGTVNVNVSGIWNNALGGNDDDCGEAEIFITGVYSEIFSRTDDHNTHWHGTQDLRWNGYGVAF